MVKFMWVALRRRKPDGVLPGALFENTEGAEVKTRAAREEERVHLAANWACRLTGLMAHSPQYF